MSLQQPYGSPGQNWLPPTAFDRAQPQADPWMPYRRPALRAVKTSYAVVLGYKLATLRVAPRSRDRSAPACLARATTAQTAPKDSNSGHCRPSLRRPELRHPQPRVQGCAPKGMEPRSRDPAYPAYGLRPQPSAEYRVPVYGGQNQVTLGITQTSSLTHGVPSVPQPA